MRAFDPTLVPPLLLLAILAGAALAIALVRTVLAQRRASRRTVELPSSHYTSQLARAAESRHRWQSIALDKIHEINREEVVRLLAKVEALGVDALRPDERIFLDTMARLAGTTTPSEPRDQGTPPLSSPDLQHRPA
jgi:hypothetical protein